MAVAALSRRSGLRLTAGLASNPVLAHRILNLDGATCSVLTHVRPVAGDDGVVRREARHLVLHATERPECGPAEVLRDPWFSGQSESTGVIEVAPPAATSCPDAWLSLIGRRLHVGAGLTLVSRSGEPADSLLAAIEQALPVGGRWDLTFVAGDDRLLDDARLHITSSTATSGESLVLNLNDPPPESSTSPIANEHRPHQGPPPQPGLTLEPSGRAPVWLSLLVLLAVVAAAIALTWWLA